MTYNMLDFLNEEQDPKMIEKICTRMDDLLSSDETLLYIAVQKKPAVNIAPNSVAVTDKRLIVFRAKSLGFLIDFEEYLWKHVLSTKTKESFFGADFIFKTVHGTEVKVDYLPKKQARKLYQLSQLQKENETAQSETTPEEPVVMNEEIFEEKPEEITPHEELFHDASEAIELVETVEIIKSQETQDFINNIQQEQDAVAALQKLKYLLNNGLITQQDFDDKKASILSRM